MRKIKYNERSSRKPIMKERKLKEFFSYDIEELLRNYGNEFLYEVAPDQAIYNMSQFEDLTCNLEKDDLDDMLSYGNFDEKDKYFYINDFGHFSSCNNEITYLKDHIEKEEFIDWCRDNSYIKDDILKESSRRHMREASSNKRVNALAKYLEINPSEIVEAKHPYDTVFSTPHTTFQADGFIYRVLTDNEANREAIEKTLDTYESAGLKDTIGSVMDAYAIANYADDDAFRNYWENSFSNEADDMYEDELIDECIELGLSKEEAEDMDTGSLSEYFINEKLNSIEHYAHEYIDTYGEDDFYDMIFENSSLIDMKALAEWDLNVIRSRGDELAYYDNNEDEVDYDGTKFFIYVVSEDFSESKKPRRRHLSEAHEKVLFDPEKGDEDLEALTFEEPIDIIVYDRLSNGREWVPESFFRSIKNLGELLTKRDMFFFKLPFDNYAVRMTSNGDIIMKSLYEYPEHEFLLRGIKPEDRRAYETFIRKENLDTLTLSQIKKFTFGIGDLIIR